MIDKVILLLWAWFSCPRKVAHKIVQQDTQPIKILVRYQLHGYAAADVKIIFSPSSEGK